MRYKIFQNKCSFDKAIAKIKRCSFLPHVVQSGTSPACVHSEICARCVQRGCVLCVRSGVQCGYTCARHLRTDCELAGVWCAVVTDVPRHVPWSHLLLLQDTRLSRTTRQAHFHWDRLVFRRRSVRTRCLSIIHLFQLSSLNVAYVTGDSMARSTLLTYNSQQTTSSV